MPRPKAPKITGVTERLLAQRWDNENQARMWLRRRGTSPSKLGLVLVDDMVGGGERGEILEAVGVKLAKADGGVVRTTARPAPVPLADPFEDYASEVDRLLDVAGEGAVPDADLRLLLAEGLSAKDAAMRIVTTRAQHLRPFVPDVVAQTNAARADAVHKDSVPLMQFDLFFVQLGRPQSRAEAEALAARAAKWSRQDAFVCAILDGHVSATFAAIAAPTAPKEVKVKDHWGQVAPLLQRAQGASVDELKRALGWKTAPGKWFVEKWALAGGRERDLEDMGHVDGVRRFRVREARR